VPIFQCGFLERHFTQIPVFVALCKGQPLLATRWHKTCNIQGKSKAKTTNAQSNTYNNNKNQNVRSEQTKNRNGSYKNKCSFERDNISAPIQPPFGAAFF